MKTLLVCAGGLAALTLSPVARADLILPWSRSCNLADGSCFRVINSAGVDDADAIVGTSNASKGVSGITDRGVGIYGWARTSGGIGVLGNAATGSYAGYFSGKVYSSCSTADGDCLYVRNTASGDDADAITGFSLASKGVQGMTSKGVGVMGRSDAAAGTGVFGSNVWGGYAGYFDGKLSVNGAAYKPGGGSWSVLSDARAKRAVTGYQAGLAALSRVRPVWYHHNGHGGTRDDGTRYVGVVAQELEANLPYMVGEGAFADPALGKLKTVDPSAFTFMLINAVNELAAQNRQLRRELDGLRRAVQRAARRQGGPVAVAPPAPRD